VAAALFWNVRSLHMASKAEIVLLLSRGRFQKLVLVVRGMGIVALQAVANRRLVHMTLDLGGILIGVAGQAKFVGNGGDQPDVGNVFIDPDFMTAQAAHRDRGVDRLTFSLVFVTSNAGGGIGLGIKGDGVRLRQQTWRKPQQHNQEQHNKDKELR